MMSETNNINLTWLIQSGVLEKRLVDNHEREIVELSYPKLEPFLEMFSPKFFLQDCAINELMQCLWHPLFINQLSDKFKTLFSIYYSSINEVFLRKEHGSNIFRVRKVYPAFWRVEKMNFFYFHDYLAWHLLSKREKKLAIPKSFQFGDIRGVTLPKLESILLPSKKSWRNDFLLKLQSNREKSFLYHFCGAARDEKDGECSQEVLNNVKELFFLLRENEDNLNNSLPKEFELEAFLLDENKLDKEIQNI